MGDGGAIDRMDAVPRRIERRSEIFLEVVV